MRIKCIVQIISKKEIDQMPNAWTTKDYLYIIDKLGFEKNLKDSAIEEMVMKLISEQTPEVIAELLLSYKLKNYLSKGEIQKLSHEIQQVKISEEYPDIFIQRELFNINQLLFKSFKDGFPSCKAIQLDMTLKVIPITYMRDENWINEIIIKALSSALGNQSAIAKLYHEDMIAKKRFPEASGILWKTEISKSMDGCFDIRLFSSEYWLHNLQTSAAYDTTIEVLELKELSYM